MVVKIVLVLRADLPPALAANAAAVLGLALGGRLERSVAADSPDASGTLHAGLNPVPVPTLVASAEELRALHDQATSAADVTVVGFNEVARRSRTYPEYEQALAATPSHTLDYVGLIVHGPRNGVTKLTKRLELMA
ncbi:DUF2000 domain-containing protein [Cellulomonas fengjieae]|uniref:DUF2000 domain-containing protein n=1 Tax=Cellulomonas fengjieae TaxID=2819978 RepID=A0ABS3SI42_9CELL|nr:DUF2000 domain-containing protein [Cellulomonas fengjieae]MBO3085423.1 DUF2000 domain-containing protein [Cellulomonas fengjieae]QVI66027.1 DUF2000 domain-containing protein [Cellulomonas fengjieae]